MPPSTDQLIERLVASAEPVRRLRPPLLRASLWLLAVAAVAALALPFFADFPLFMKKTADPEFIIEMIGTLLTGIGAIIAAFYLSLPDRSPLWALLPLPPLALWLASSGYNCYREWIVVGANGWHFGESSDCFSTILGFSVPLGLALLLVLRRARPIAPVPVAVTGGLGVAALSAFLLQFNHPVDASFLDLGMHAAAVGLVVVAATALSRYRGGAALSSATRLPPSDKNGSSLRGA
jgi:hypothetical protein